MSKCDILSHFMLLKSVLNIYERNISALEMKQEDETIYTVIDVIYIAADGLF